MNPDYIPIVTTVITVVGSVFVAFGTWNVSMKQMRKKEHEEVLAILNNHKEETSRQIRSLQDDVTQVNATVQTQIAIIETKIDTLSERVDKHNNLIERTYKLEQDTAVHTEQIKVANHRLSDLEKKD